MDPRFRGDNSWRVICLLRDAPCSAHLREDRIQAIDHADDFLPRDVERRHEAQRVRLWRVEQHTILKRLRDDRGTDGVFQIEREQQTPATDVAETMARG